MPIDINKDTEKSALKKLKAREDALRQLEAVAGLGSWEVDLLTNSSVWSDKSFEIYKVPKDEKVSLDTFFKMLLDEYQEEAKQKIQEAVTTKRPVTFSGQLKRRDGKIISILINATAVFDEKGSPIKFIGTTQDITEFVALQEHTKELSDLIEHSSNEVYIVDFKTLDYLYVNQGARDALGYSEQELLRMNVRDINPYLRDIDIENLRTLLININKVLNRTIHQRKDGSYYHVQSYIHTLEYHGKEAYVIFDIDISQTIELELEYKKQANVLEHIHDSVISTDIYGKITSWNKGSRNLFGFEAQEILNKNIKSIYAKENEQTLDELFTSIAKGGSIDAEVYMLKKDKSKIICDISLSILKDEFGRVEGYVGYIQDITKEKETEKLLKEQSQRLYYQAHHDILTSLPNRTLFKERLSQAVVNSKRNHEVFALLFIDLDQFKKINDSLGHHIGDEVLKEAAKRLQNNIREQDTLSRLGGDEFTIILRNIKEAKNAALVARKIIEHIKEPMNIASHVLHISSSIGISIYPEDTKDENDLIKYADTAMYSAKDKGRDNYQFYSAEMTEEAYQRVILENSLRIAIKEKQFLVYYQPQYEIDSNTIVGMEALVRWRHPNAGMISPGDFIPIAQDSGLIIEIDKLVMQEAMEQFVLWYKQGFNPGKLSLNLAMKQLDQDDFVNFLLSTMNKLQFEPKWLELEVTEGDIMKNPDKAISKLTTLHAFGIDMAIDDFGTGYSSLSYLKKLPLDKLKIDQSFIKDIPEDEDDVAITKAIIALGESLNLKLIAEGVETQEQKEFLYKSGCKLIQGYLYSKPIPQQEIEKLLTLQ